MISFDIKGETTSHHESDEGFLWNIHLYIILMSGDVHPNPGPTDTSVVPLKMCHLNVRSICVSQKSDNLNLHAGLLEPQQSRSRACLRPWQQELRLLKGDQSDQSMRQVGPFLQSDVSFFRWTSGVPVSGQEVAAQYH